jgi:hypothetical protein
MASSLIATIIMLVTGCIETLPVTEDALLGETILSYAAENNSTSMPMNSLIGNPVSEPAEDPQFAPDYPQTPPPTDASFAPMPAEISIIGDSTALSENQTAYFSLVATYSDGSTRIVTSEADWSVTEDIGYFNQPGIYRTPATVPNGTRVTIEARYEDNGQNCQTSLELTISHENAAPTIDQGNFTNYKLDMGDHTAGVNQLTLTATDAENDNLSWQIDSASTYNGQARITGLSTGNRIVIAYEPNEASFTGLDTFAVTVSDPFGGSARIDVKVEVVRETVYARDFASGFNTTDVTACLQTAIDSGAARVVVTNEGSPWITGPIQLASNQEIYFEEGVIVQAKANDEEGKPFTTYQSFFVAKDKSNITLIGNGAILKMNKSEYTNGQWRHVLSLNGSTNVIVKDLTLKDSGGDGVYVGIGNNQKYCKNIYLQNLVCDSNYRNAISIISVENLYINDCVLTKTSGSPPQSGIDIEPNLATNFFHRLININIQNTQIIDNAGNGITMCFRNMDSSFPNISINFENVTVSGNVGLQIMNLWDNGPDGLINFRNLTIQDADYGIKIYNKSDKSAKIQFESCLVSGIALKSSSPIKVSVYESRSAKVGQPGGINFSDCTVIDQYKRPVMEFTDEISSDGKGIWDITGTINISNIYGAYVDWNGATQNEVSLVLRSETSN